MMNQITCPSCKYEFDVEGALALKLEAKYKIAADQRIAEQARLFQAERAKLDSAQAEFQKKKAKENELFKQRLDKAKTEQQLAYEQKLQQERQAIELKAKQSYSEHFEMQLKILQADNEKKQAENKALKAKEIEFLQKEKALKEQQEELEMTMQKKLLEESQLIEEKARATEREANLLKEKKYQKQLEDQKKLIDEMKRKAEQGSIQMQGEIQELALEELLAKTYPFDVISQVPKGVRGADCLQTVVNNRQQECGSIVYESKRTKNWGGDWLEKLKQDQIGCKADLAVLVTETMPNDLERFGLKDGVWVCSFHEVKSLSMALRQQLISIHSVKSAEDNKGDKMELLYAYLTSSEFAQNISRIIDNYDVMQQQLLRERRAMEKIWKEREKQIWVVQENISSLFGSIKGIAGNELQNIPSLELGMSLEQQL